MGSFCMGLACVYFCIICGFFVVQKHAIIFSSQMDPLHCTSGYRKKSPLLCRILNNNDWYSQRSMVDFLSTLGRKFRIGSMMHRER